MKLVLDAGALIAIDRSDRRVAGLIELGRRNGAELISVAPVVAQVWRKGSTQARLARSLQMIDVRSVRVEDAKDAGELLASTGSSDVVDALLALAVLPGDQVLTSDSDDLKLLVKRRRIKATVVAV